MEKDGFVFSTESMSAPHHVSEDSEFVRTLLEAYEVYTGRKGGCVAIGGGTYVHDLKMAWPSARPCRRRKTICMARMNSP